ncbi:MAG: hypothetical protein IKI57_06560 [Clostridia bacterium]|nr:hypothetical protein [Clostridia bacterium]
MTEEEKLELEEDKAEKAQKLKEKKAKKKAKEERSFNRLKKAFWVLFVAYIFLFVFWGAINKYITVPKDIYTKVGSNNSGLSIPMSEAYIIEELAINTFKDYLREEDFEAAYNMCCKEYKAYKSYEDFCDYAQRIEPDSFRMKQIKAKTDYALEAQIVYDSGDQRIDTIYIIYPDEFKKGTYYFSPEKFLYMYENQDFKNDGITLHVDKCVVFTDKVEMTGTIKNDSFFDTLAITELGASYSGTLNKWTPFEKTLAKGEETEFNLIFEDLHYFIPNSLMIRRQKSDTKIRTYEFTFKENEKRS